MALTGLMAIAANSLINGQGLSINREFRDLVDQYSSQHISGSVQKLLERTPAQQLPAIIDALSLAPDFMTGFCPDGIDLGPNVNNVPKAVLTQALTIFPNIPFFISLYKRANSYAIQSFEFMGSIAQAQNFKFEDLGFIYKNYNDVLTGGITSQFNIEAVPRLAEELINLGTLIPVNDLSKIGDVAVIINSLLEQGLGYVGNIENQIKQNNIDLNDVTDEDQTILLNILKGIRGSDLDEIFQVTNFKPAHLEEIKNLSDILDIKKVFSVDALKAIDRDDTFSDLSRKFNNIGGNFNDTIELSDFYKNLNLKSYDSLNERDTLLSPSEAAELTEHIGQGTGFFKNPTMVDLLGSVSGIGYSDDLKEIIQTQISLLESDSEILEFKNFLDQGNNVTPENIKLKISGFSSKSNLSTVFQEINRKFRNSAERLAIEKTNLTKSQLLNGLIPASNEELLNFASQLHSYSLDPMQLRITDLLVKVVDNDSSGQAIEACLFEGKNLSLMSKVGINTGTFLDPMDYAQKIGN
jgi:hypothetical protein